MAANETLRFQRLIFRLVPDAAKRLNGDMLLVALNIPPSSTGTYSNLTPVRFSIPGMAGSAE